MSVSLSRFVRTLDELSSTEDVDLILKGVLDSLISTTGAERGIVLEYRPRRAWRVCGARNVHRQELGKTLAVLSNTVLDRARLRRTPWHVPDIEAHPEWSDVDSLRSSGRRSMFLIPLHARDKRVGVVVLDHRRPHAFENPDEEAVKGLVAVAAVALDRAYLIRDLREALDASEAQCAREACRARVSEAELAQALEELADSDAPAPAGGLVGQSREFVQFLNRLDRAAGVDYPVHLYGESGTGKELAARSLHARSRRAGGPFVVADCGALQESLLGSELFGHVKGAFTGADTDRRGLFESADGGTLFLDEVQNMTPGMQESLLRVLQEGVVRPVGGSTGRAVDVRLISASNQSLPDLVEAGSFRADLLYRIRVIALVLPPLRRRIDDLPLLVDFFLGEIGSELGRAFSVSLDAMDRLSEHSWPGNVRELQNLLRSVAAFSDGLIRCGDVDEILPSTAPDLAEEFLSTDGYQRKVVEAYQRQMSDRDLALRLGVSRETLWRKRKLWGMPRPEGQ
jgi:transcriptional regulator with GAF, ATPase, and Fis domain